MFLKSYLHFILFILAIKYKMKVKIDFGNKIKSIFVAFLLSVIGAIALIFIKKIDSKELSKKWLLLPILINVVSVFLVSIGLKYSSITIFNIEWNLISTILVTGISVLYLNEVHSVYEISGLVLAFIAMFILNVEHIQQIISNKNH